MVGANGGRADVDKYELVAVARKCAGVLVIRYRWLA